MHCNQSGTQSYSVLPSVTGLWPVPRAITMKQRGKLRTLPAVTAAQSSQNLQDGDGESAGACDGESQSEIDGGESGGGGLPA